MIELWRGNSYTEIHGAPAALLHELSHNLAIEIKPDPKTKKGTRFGFFFKAVNHMTDERTYWGSLMHGNRVPAGLTPHVRALLAHKSLSYNLRDIRQKPDDEYPLFYVGAKWRPYQDVAHKQILKYGVGVVDAPPRSGKTLMAARAIDILNKKTLYLAPSLAIVKQTYEVLKSHFGDNMVARLDSEAKAHEKDISKKVVVATAASAVKLPQEFYDACDVLVIDEFHHGAAETYHRINALAVNIFYRICFTGTHFRTADDRMAMEALCSEVLYQIPVDYLVRERYLSPYRIVFAPSKGKPIYGSSYSEAYDEGIVESEGRNRQIELIARVMGLDNRWPTLVLVRRRHHARILGEMIPDSAVVRGGEDALTNSTIEAFRRNEVPILIGTTVIGEGVDLPNAQACVYASGGGASVQQIQSYFRPLTGGKDEARIFDFRDYHHATLMRQSNDRMGFAEEHLKQRVVKL